jgi:hypothetical protein
VTASIVEEHDFEITTREGESFDIPVEGSLGLLALGDIGIWAWRQKIDEVKREMATRSQQSAGPHSGDEGSPPNEPIHG